eukprot:TRINITY_DN56398_c0_g1_i1.p1 TRINITY_DN56398_c0_g1~~TRINITY_DN56398_c0_g1_i1.p1  ORF type:complete len:218 (-),score=28.16 TRINITY_DN56398_c0_g1_i1:323-976(-)
MTTKTTSVLPDTIASRVRRRENDISKLLLSQFTVTVIDPDDYTSEFWVRFDGPEESPYHGGVWQLHVTLPKEYPYKSPSIGFHNRIYHPNVDEPSGTVCLDVINQTWTPLYDLVNIFSIFIPQLLLNPNPSDPLNTDAAALYSRDRARFEEHVRNHVARHARVVDATIPDGKVISPVRQPASPVAAEPAAPPPPPQAAAEESEVTAVGDEDLPDLEI